MASPQPVQQGVCRRCPRDLRTMRVEWHTGFPLHENPPLRPHIGRSLDRCDRVPLQGVVAKRARTSLGRLFKVGFRDRKSKPDGGYPMTTAIGYHAHVYFDPTTRPVAERLRDAIVSRFAVEPGAFSDAPRGTHPISQLRI